MRKLLGLVLLAVLTVTTLVLIVPIAGGADADADAVLASVGFVDPSTGQWHLKDTAGDVHSFYFGKPGDYPIMGDWNCNGIDTPGLYRQSDGYVYLRNSNTQGIADIRFFFGNPGDVPIAGDFDGDGCDTVSIYRQAEGRVYIVNALGANDGGLGAADYAYYFGNPGDKPFTGDFNGNGVTTIGLHRESSGFVYFRNSHTQGIADNEFYYGDPGDRLVAADWFKVDGIDTPAVFRPAAGTTYFRHSNSQGVADSQLEWGQLPWIPVAGVFGLPSSNGSPTPTSTTMPIYGLGDLIVPQPSSGPNYEPYCEAAGWSGYLWDDYVTGDLSSAAWYHTYYFCGKRGVTSYLQMEATSGNLDPVVKLYQIRPGQSDRLIAVSDDSVNPYDNPLSAVIHFVVPEDGSYRVTVTRFRESSGITEGGYSLFHYHDEGNKDSDFDGMSDINEHALIEAFKPLWVFDESETWGCVDVERETATIYQVTPIESIWDPVTGSERSRAVITVVFLNPEDCGAGPWIFPNLIRHAHPGDNETVRVVVEEDRNFNWYVERLVMKRHFDDPEEFIGSYPGVEYHPPTYGRESHPVIYASLSKHASYLSNDDCDGYSYFGIHFEDCAGGPVLDLFTPSSHNVGEAGSANVADYLEADSYEAAFPISRQNFDWLRASPILTQLYGSELAWTHHEFCGGDPAYAHPAFIQGKCAGALQGKWWTFGDDLPRQLYNSDYCSSGSARSGEPCP